jgi:hypothetical protein
MIKISKTYHLALTEQQAQELYELLRTEKDSGCLTPDKELVVVYDELKKLFDTGIQSTENSKYYKHLYAPGTK